MAKWSSRGTALQEQFSSRPRSQAREHDATVNCTYGPLFSCSSSQAAKQSIAEDRYLSDPHARVHSFYRQRVQLPALATGLAQGPVRDGGTGMHWSFPTGGGLPSSYQAPGRGHLPALPQRRRDGRASGVPVPGP